MSLGFIVQPGPEWVLPGRGTPGAWAVLAVEQWVWLVTGFCGEKEAGSSSFCSFLAICSKVYFGVYYKPVDSLLNQNWGRILRVIFSFGGCSTPQNKKL